MNKEPSFNIRPIRPHDNAAMAEIIHQVLGEYDADKPGFASQDAEMADLFTAYQPVAHAYWVVESGDGEIIGGVGIAPLQPEIEGVCELRKMYLKGQYRGQGWGRALLEQALSFAALHYRWCYLETLQRMPEALALYRGHGFMSLPRPLIETEHHGCDYWLLCELSQQ